MRTPLLPRCFPKSDSSLHTSPIFTGRTFQKQARRASGVSDTVMIGIFHGCRGHEGRAGTRSEVISKLGRKELLQSLHAWPMKPRSLPSQYYGCGSTDFVYRHSVGRACLGSGNAYGSLNALFADASGV